MSGQHVGTLSDSITEDVELSGARARLARVMRPSGKVYKKDGHSLGNGAVCPDVPEHGKMYALPSGRDWCPDQSHDDERMEKSDG